MSIKPTPGEQYIVVKGDTLWDISASAYGNPREWKTIYNANKSTLRDPTIYSSDKYPAIVKIFPGEILVIPPDNKINKLKSDNTKTNNEDKKEENIRFIIEGKEIEVENARVILSIDTMADGFSFTTDAQSLEGNYKHFSPFNYADCDVYIDDIKLISGCIFKPRFSSDSKGGETLSISGFSKTKHLIDSTSEPPYLYNNKTLKQVIEEIGSPFSIKPNDIVKDTFKFKRLKIEPNEKIGQFLLNLAYQRNVLLRSNTNNEIEIIRANVNGKSIITIEDGTEFLDPLEAEFDGEKRASKYVATGKKPRGCIKGVYKDDRIKAHRVFYEKFNDNDADEITKPAEWMYRRALAESIDIGFSMNTFYSDNELIRENNMVSIEKKTYFISPGMKLLIKSVEFSQDKDSKSCRVSLTLPHIYTTDPINEDWG
jgi:prophage tail gpP-like protein